MSQYSQYMQRMLGMGENMDYEVNPLFVVQIHD